MCSTFVRGSVTLVGWLVPTVVLLLCCCVLSVVVHCVLCFVVLLCIVCCVVMCCVLCVVCDVGWLAGSHSSPVADGGRLHR